MFECNKCYQKFKYNYLLIRHENNKKSCNKPHKIIKHLNDKIIDVDKKILELDKLSFESKDKCFYCDTKFSTKNNLNRHITLYCNDKKNFLEDKIYKYYRNKKARK